MVAETFQRCNKGCLELIPELASNFKYTAPCPMLPSVLSTVIVEIWYSSLLTAWCNFVRPTYIRMSPFGHGTTTMRGKGTPRGRSWHNGFVSALSWASPLNRFG